MIEPGRSRATDPAVGNRAATAALCAGAVLVAGGTGAAIAADLAPAQWILLGLAVVATATLLWPFHRGVPLLLLLAAVPLFPVTTIGPYQDALGGHGSDLRAGLIAVALVALTVAWHGRIPKPPQSLRPVVIGLLLLAALGVVDAYANSSATQGFGSLLQQLLGQPLAFAGILVFLCAYLAKGGARSRDLVLAAFSAGVFAEAALIAAELLSGGAFDALRGFTRAQGTVGANFVSAFAMMAAFVGMAEYTRGSRQGPRWLAWTGTATVLAAGFILITAVARGGVIGLVLGGLYLLVADPRLRRRIPIIVPTAVVLLALSAPTPIGDLWTDRLTADSVEQFDRPATWVSGIRIGLDQPWTGLGELEIVRGLTDVREYRQTPLGDTSVLPHNSWILVFAEGGFAALLILIGLTVLTILSVRRPPGGRSREERYYVAALIGIFAVAMINNVFRHPELMVVVLMLVSLIAVREPRVGSRAG